jgi:hypothetical protein
MAVGCLYSPKCLETNPLQKFAIGTPNPGSPSRPLCALPVRSSVCAPLTKGRSVTARPFRVSNATTEGEESRRAEAEAEQAEKELDRQRRKDKGVLGEITDTEGLSNLTDNLTGR